MSCQPISGLHPLCRCSKARLIWTDTVRQVNPVTWKQKQRTLVITSLGMFLAHRTGFPSKLVLKEVLQLSELILVRLDPMTMEFFAPKVSLVLQHFDQAHIVAMVLTIRKKLFGDRPRKVQTVYGTPELQKAVEDDTFEYKCKSVLADRFLSLCLGLPHHVIIPEELDLLHKRLESKKHKSLTLDAEKVASTIILPFCRAIAYDEYVSRLRLRDLDFALFLSHFIGIIERNSSVQRVDFIHVAFNGQINEYLTVWDDKTEFAGNEFFFEHCDLSVPEFRPFLEAFSKYPADMKCLCFKQCKIDGPTLEKIFQAIMVSRCFRTLTELCINTAGLGDTLTLCIMQTFASTFLLQHMHLFRVDFSYSGLDVDQLLPCFLRYDTPVKSVVLSGNNFLKYEQCRGIDDFRQLRDLTLSETAFTTDSLISLLRSLAVVRGPLSLTLDKLKIQQSDWKDVYNSLEGIVIPTLHMFSWCNNMMSGEQMQRMSGFIVNQPTLTSLGLSNSFVFSDTNQGIYELINIVRKKAIKKLELKSTGVQALGVKLVPFLRELLEQGNIAVLDVTGQGISDDGLEIIAELSESTLEHVRFDGSHPSSYEVMLAVIDRITNASLCLRDWPVADEKFVLDRIPLADKPDVVHRVKTARSRFERATGAVSDSRLSSTRIMDRSPSIDALFSIDTEPVVIDPRILQLKSVWTCQAIKEVMGTRDIGEPLTEAISRLDYESSLEQFLTRDF